MAKHGKHDLGPNKPRETHDEQYWREANSKKKVSDHKDFMSDSNTKPNKGGREFQER